MSKGIMDRKKKQNMANQLVEETGMAKSIVEILQKRYEKLCAGSTCKKMDRQCFKEILHQEFDITSDTIQDRIFKVFNRSNNNNFIGMEDWIYGLSVYLRGKFEDRVKFMFQVYDMNGDQFISRDEVFSFLNTPLHYSSPGDEDPDESVKDLVELALKRLDSDNDGKISMHDFQESVKGDYLLMESLGKCFPKDDLCLAYLGMGDDYCLSCGNK